MLLSAALGQSLVLKPSLMLMTLTNFLPDKNKFCHCDKKYLGGISFLLDFLSATLVLMFVSECERERVCK